MRILHIASIQEDPFTGVSVSVPEHVIYQGKYADVSFMNISNVYIPRLQRQIAYHKAISIEDIVRAVGKPDLVIFHECYRIQYLSLARLFIDNKIPYIIVPHGELRKEAQRKKALKKKVANLLLFNSFIENAVAIQCLSQAELNATSFHHQKFIGSNGISLPQTTKTLFNSNKVKFIYIGRYEWRVKGFDLLVKAVQQIAPFMRENHCSIDMYGPDILGRYDKVQNLIQEHGVSDLINLHHAIGGTEKIEKLLGSDVFIQTSRHEGMPMGILEAMSYGLPCLITEGTTLGEVVKRHLTGWVANTEVVAISEQIIKSVMERDNWKTYGNNARNLIFEQYEWHIVAHETVEKYVKLIK